MPEYALWAPALYKATSLLRAGRSTSQTGELKKTPRTTTKKIFIWTGI